MTFLSGKYNTISDIHQVLIIDGLNLPDVLPRLIKTNRDHALDLYPGAKYKLWSGNNLRAFIEDEVGKEALYAFNTLKPYSYKCDLARYCLLWARGGIYFDLAIRMLNRWDIPNHFKIAAFTETYDGMESWTATQTSLLWSEPGRPEWKHAIDSIIENCHSRYYGPHDHYPTAGALLGRSFARAIVTSLDCGNEDEQWMGECRYVTPERQMQNVCYVSPDKRIIGMRTKLSAGDLTELGLGGTNNYTKIFRSRQVYGEKDRFWFFNDPRIVCDSHASKTTSGIMYERSRAGRISYGPFVDLDAGIYKLQAEFSEQTPAQRIRLDVSASYGKEILFDSHLQIISSNGKKLIECTITLSAPQEAVEFRVYVAEEFGGHLLSFTLKEASELYWSSTGPEIQSYGVKTEKGLRVTLGQTGRVSHGPYVPLDRGKYRLVTHLINRSSTIDLITEVCSGSGNNIIEVKDLSTTLSCEGSQTGLSFVLEKPETDIEFRTEAFGNFDGEIVGFSLYRNSEGP